MEKYILLEDSFGLLSYESDGFGRIVSIVQVASDVGVMMARRQSSDSFEAGRGNGS